MNPWMHFSVAVQKTAGKSIRSPLFGTILFGDDKTVEQFVEQYPSSTERGEREVCFTILTLCSSCQVKNKSKNLLDSRTTGFKHA